MSISLSINGQVFEYPQNFDEDWGVDATGWAQAVTAGALYLSGGNFPLTAAVDFGSSFGIKVLSITSKSSNSALAEYLRLSKSDAIAWRNNANTADLSLAIDGSDMLTFNGSVLGLTSLVTNKIFIGDISNEPAAVSMSGDATIVAAGTLTIANGAINNVKVASGAAIAVNKLATLTASSTVVTDSSGFISASGTTATEIGYVSGVTSSIQTQINAIAAFTVPSGVIMDFAGIAAPTGWFLCDGSAVSRTTFSTLFAAIGTVWGAGDGSTTFNIPNMTRRIGMGSGGTGTGVIGNAVGNTGGEETHTLTIPEIPSHQHSTDPVCTTNGGFNKSPAGTGAATVNDTAGVVTTFTGGGGAHNNVQPAAIVLKIIKF